MDPFLVVRTRPPDLLHGTPASPALRAQLACCFAAVLTKKEEEKEGGGGGGECNVPIVTTSTCPINRITCIDSLERTLFLVTHIRCQHDSTRHSTRLVVTGAAPMSHDEQHRYGTRAPPSLTSCPLLTRP